MTDDVTRSRAAEMCTCKANRFKGVLVDPDCPRGHGRTTPDRVVRMADVLEAVEAAYIKYPGRAKNDKRDHWYASQYKDALVERLRSVPDA